MKIIFKLFVVSVFLINPNSINAQKQKLIDVKNQSLVCLSSQLSKEAFLKSAKEESEFSLIEVRLTGIRAEIHSNDCTLMDGTITIRLAEKSNCKNKFYVPISGDKTFKGLRDYDTSWTRWKAKKIAQFNRRNMNQKSPNNYDHTLIYKVPTKLINDDNIYINFSHFIQACHTQNKGLVFGQNIGNRKCNRVYVSRSRDLFFNTRYSGNTQKKAKLKDGPISLKTTLRGQEGSHYMALYFKVSILK